MSRKALAVIEKIRLAAIEKMSPKEINNLLCRKKEQVDYLTSQLSELKAEKEKIEQGYKKLNSDYGDLVDINKHIYAENKALKQEWISVEPSDDYLNDVGRGKFLVEVDYVGEAITATTVDCYVFDKRAGWLIANKGPLKPTVKQWTVLPTPSFKENTDES